MKKTYKIEVDCPVCAGKMENATKSVAGVADASVAFVPQKMRVVFEEGVDIDAVMAEVVKACKAVESDFEIYL